MSPRSIIVAGAGIGGLTAALALARNGLRVIVLEQAERLEETGAGIQLSPNAARILIDLGLESRLRPSAVAPAALRVLDGVTGREIVRMPLGEYAEQRYGAPFWTIHRGDLQAALAAAAASQPDITVKLGMQVEDFVAHPNGLTVSARGRGGVSDAHGVALIGADGLWSLVRKRIGHRAPPRFAGRTAWRALVPARAVAPEFREPLIHLWLGRDAHLVHYPVKAGRVINIVVITADSLERPGLERARRPRRSHSAPGRRRLDAAGANARQPAGGVAQMGAVRSPFDLALVARTRGAPRRRRPPGAALSGAGGRNGDRGRGGGGAVSRAHAE